ncbi:GTP pyrophosphokinase [Nocardia sp. CA-129566]|uniref:GTP pyrophosphokinase n=1 Tax=Nocardia sp. CA-129566 TaxID=3239976 RepID=UPI003D97A1FE
MRAERVESVAVGLERGDGCARWQYARLVPGANENIDFEQATADLDDFGVSLIRLISELLREAHLHVHSLGYRVKGRDSAGRKLARGGAKYAGYLDLTDLLGIRIITYFSDDVDNVAAALVPEFDIDEENSVDKRAALGVDSFGYLSLHYIARLNSVRSQLVEYRRFNGRKFEIQIRSILQHAWAEIEHDLGYKANRALPDEFRRKFSQLAGHLELADSQFINIRDGLGSYAEHVNTQLRGRMHDSLTIDQYTLAAFADDALVVALDRKIADAYHISLARDIDLKYISNRALTFPPVGISDIGTLKRLMLTRYDQIVAFTHEWAQRPDLMVDDPEEISPRGVSFYYALLSVLGSAGDQIGNLVAKLPNRSSWSSREIADVPVTWARVASHVRELSADENEPTERGET